MQCIISNGAPQAQQLTHEWYGMAVNAPVHFSFSIEEDALVFRAWQDAAVSLPPYAVPGAFTEKLWMYDVAEFFIAAADGSRYMEFNLCPNGAWWACVFGAPRAADPAFAAPKGVTTTGAATPAGWRAAARIPLSELAAMGIEPQHCRLAATAILNSPDYLFLTTAEDVSGEPDFHRPHAWTAAQLS